LSEISDQNFFKLKDEFSSHSSVAVPDLDPNTPETEETFRLTTSYIISLFSGTAAINDPTEVVEPVAGE
jgi:hypothetical protein